MEQQQAQANEPQAKSTEQTKLEHSYEVLETGEVKVTQEQTLVFVWDQRDFLTLYRGNEKALEETRLIMGEEHMKKMQKQEDKIIKEMDIMKPIVDESERLSKINYEKMIITGMTTQLKAAINAKEFNDQWWINIWTRGKEERKKIIIDSLNSDEKALYARAKIKMKRKGIIK